MSDAMIRIRHLGKSFGDLEVLKDVNCDIEQGEVISIIGPSGTGKSTLLRALNLLDPPTAGEIFVSGENILAPGVDVNRLRQKMGMVFQPFNLYSHLSVAENIMLAPMHLCRTGRREAYGRALDPTMVSEVISAIRGLSGRGLTMLIVTHEMRVARDISTRVFYRDEGVIFEDGTPDQIFNHAEREQTRRFVKRVRSLCYHVTSATFYLYELNGRLEGFCTRHVVDSRRMGKAELVCEEMIVNLLVPRFGHRTVDIELEVEFSEDTNDQDLTVIFPDLGAFLLEGGGLPEMIVGSTASEITQSSTDGKTTIRMSL